MKKLRRFLPWILIAGLAAAVIAARGVMRHHHAGHAPHSDAAQKTAPLYYCPMHPGYTSDRPGECPICHMTLVKREPSQAPRKAASSFEHICVLHNCPKLHEGRPCPMMVVSQPGEKVNCPVCGEHVVPGPEAAGPEGYGAVLLSPQKRQLIGLTTAPVQRRALSKTIRTVGQIAYDPELYQAQQEFLQALRMAQQAQATLPGILPAGQVAEGARSRLRLMGLDEKFIDEVSGWDAPDERLLLRNAAGEVWLYAPVYEYELPYVRTGMRVAAEIPGIPGGAWEGTVRSIDPVVDPATRSARVRALLTDAQGLLRPGMYVDASLVVEAGEVPALPAGAVMDTGARKVVFVDKGEGVLEPRTVILGIKADGFYELRSGVELGEQVVTSGNFLVDSESRLQAVLEGAQQPGEHKHGP